VATTSSLGAGLDGFFEYIWSVVNPGPLKSRHQLRRVVDRFSARLLPWSFSVAVEPPNNQPWRAVVTTDLAELIQNDRFGLLARLSITISHYLKVGSSLVLSHITAPITWLPARQRPGLTGNMRQRTLQQLTFGYILFEAIRGRKMILTTLSTMLYYNVGFDCWTRMFLYRFELLE